MNPSSATSLYLSACRAALRCDPQKPESFTELYNLLPFFRDTLSCLACGNLLQDPVALSGSSCQNFVCRGCKEKTLKLKRSCSCCKNAKEFEENKQLQVLVDCYRSLCEYVWVIIREEQNTSLVEGYTEVVKMLEEVLEIKDEQVESSEEEKILDVPQETLDNTETSQPTTEASSLCEVVSEEKTVSDVVLDDHGLLSSVDITTELHSPKLDTSSGIIPNLSVQTFSTDAITISISSDDVIQGASTSPILLSVEEVLNSLESDCSTKQIELDVPDIDNGSSVLQEPQSTSGGSLASTQPLQPQTGVTCQVAAPVKANLTRKRSRSESDSEIIQPLPITSLIQKPSVATTVPPQAACEPKAQNVPAAIQNGAVLKVNRTLADSTKNFQKNTESPIVKKVPSRPKMNNAPRPKPRPKVSDGNPTKVVYKKPQEKKGCKCGRATQNPSVLTCRGQRCPCYSNRKACLDCICRGCQNSYMANGEKKLEAFAVPEKALEQTRLTLGINLTSISVINAGNNAGVLSLSAGSPMTSFLTTNSEQDSGFEDPLKMHFDC